MTVYVHPPDLAVAVTLLRGIADDDHDAMALAMNDPEARPWSVAGIIGALFVDLIRYAHAQGVAMSVDELLDVYGLAGATMTDEAQS